MRIRHKRRNAGKVVSVPGDENKGTEVKQAKPVTASKPAKIIRQIINNPNFSVQVMTILLTLASDNIPMERRINNVTATVDKVRNITDVITNTMQSVKVATEAPKQIRQLLKPDE
ncbi:Hypothetical protein LUCI_4056 [Lucifera butyrica]|uniref:Uncharacterized protein n=1 Tax=Lucifera butyrica TaxID=1351585 RepID=A0A498RCL7_9FIRM|nr:hypothetical protein [Lucifera butyrica]VBB08775.1 Hypothetical protein LUCI_4056 [Lucifera butyrica]